MFDKVLVANRGEIAVRVMRTLREMGIRSVAVFSEADRNAMHVRMADEAIQVGPAPATQSYLRIEAVLEAARRSGARAIHPGYGFLSENPAFARACAEAGVTFIGPPPEAMEAMGSKTAARERMTAAGVPVVPGAHAGSLEELEQEADRIGYPVMLKAAAGGGGKGMRLVERPEELSAAYERARSEARKAFGDPTVYLEKAILQPRHIEIQVLADAHGHVVHLFERDCSVQRRHQKVVEETPSPAPSATPERIAEMGEVAVRAARAVDYVGAGTVEFLMAPDGSFYFLEMNTRLQVEHPITELVTGLDLVREQVRIAAGEPLGFTQDEVQRRGHAIECRIYAEDPETFLPAPGHLERLRVPAGPGVRDDAGVEEGDEVSSFYDPLLSKLCVWAPNREQAVARMRRALGEYVALGTLRTNVAFHRRLFELPAFVRGDYDTGLIERHREELLAAKPLPPERARVMAAAVALAQSERDAAEARAAARNNGAPRTLSVQPSAWRAAALPRGG